MKTSFNIPDEELKALLYFTKAKSKREAIMKAISEYNQRRRLERLGKHLGSFEDFMTQDDLKKMREDRRWEQKK